MAKKTKDVLLDKVLWWCM